MKILNKVLATGLMTGGLLTTNASWAEGPGSGVELFRANEFSIDVFASGAIDREVIDDISGARVRDEFRFGAGAGFNYFFTRNLGLGFDAYSEDTENEFIDNASANLILRLPIGESGFAPYVFGGATYQFDTFEQWCGNAGGGFEFRFDEHWSLFTDARYVFTDETEDYGMARAGLRLSF